MAMIKCSECDKDISDKAKVCINCGAPIINNAENAGNILENLREQAALGDKVAQRLLGSKYENGEGVALDNDKAVHWYCLAATQGDIEAQENLGRMCEKGQVAINGQQVGDISGDGKIDYEDFKLALINAEKNSQDNINGKKLSGKEELHASEESDASKIEKLANNAGPIIKTESQIKRDKFKAALENTIDIKFADVMRTKTGESVYLTYVDAQILTAAVRNVFKHLLHITPPQVESALMLSEAVLAPSALQRLQLIKSAVGTGGAAAGIVIVLGAVGTALGWGASATAGFITFFTGAHLLGPLAWAASGLALAGFAGYFAMTSNNQMNTERFLKVLKNSVLKSIDAIWEEHEVTLSKILTST